MPIVGLDLAGVETRPTGFCILTGMKVEACLVYEDEKIMSKIKEIKPRIITVDAPLSLPPGRKTLEERTGIHLRECDRELLKRGIKFFLITIGPMRKLTARGMHLKYLLEEQNLIGLEVYSGGAQDVLGIPRKQKGLAELRAGLGNLGIKGLNREMSDHELDAITCAHVGKLFLAGEAVVCGDPSDGIVMPKGEQKRNKAIKCHLRLNSNI